MSSSKKRMIYIIPPFFISHVINRTVLGSREFSEPNYIQCVCFDPKGEFISEFLEELTTQYYYLNMH